MRKCACRNDGTPPAVGAYVDNFHSYRKPGIIGMRRPVRPQRGTGLRNMNEDYFLFFNLYSLGIVCTFH